MPGLAGDRDDRADPVGQALERVAHLGELGVAADERALLGGRARLDLAHDAVAVDRLGAAAQRRRAELLELERRAHLHCGLRAEQ